jgi:small conductance mechanosensitive channel
LKTPIIKLAGLFLACLVATHTFAQITVDEDTRSIETLVKTLDEDIESLRVLMREIETAKDSDRHFLVYRQDERVFGLFADYEALVLKTANLPEGVEERKSVKQHLVAYGTDLGPALFRRIDEIKENVIKHTAEMKELSGAQLVAAQAYLHAMESIRINYYKVLASFVANRDVMGFSSPELREKLAADLNLYAETLAGRIEYTGAARSTMQQHLSMDKENADIDHALKALNISHVVNLERLEAMISVFDSLGLDSSRYKAIMLTEADSISINFFSLQAIGTVIKSSWSALLSAVKNNAADLIIRILLFMAVLLIFRTLARITKRVVRAATNKSKLDMSELLKNILVSTSGGAVMAMGVLMALSQVGISLAPMLAGLGVVGFIVGFALQDTLGNFAAGAMILIYRPFDVGDLVEVTGASGLVQKMNLVSTTITTLDNQTLVVPNSKIWGDVIKNVTSQTERRVDLVFGIGYGDDIELAEKVLTEIVDSHEKILRDPEPKIKLHTLADSSVNFIVRPWTKTEDYWDVYWDLTREVKLRFDREGISIPFPQTDVHLYSEQDT